MRRRKLRSIRLTIKDFKVDFKNSLVIHIGFPRMISSEKGPESMEMILEVRFI